MKVPLEKFKTAAKLRTGNIVLFSYALVIGTALPIALSRCSANCLSCGSCSLYLGIIPIIAAVALRNQIKKGWHRLCGSFSHVTKLVLRKGYE